MITSTKNAAWVNSTPCAGVSGYIPDATLVRSPDKLVAECAPLMQDCADICPFMDECYELVRPHTNHFDGVCAARLWIDGKVVANAEGAPPLTRLATRAGMCGTSSGVKGHLRLNEPLCGACRVTAHRAEVRRAGAASIRSRSSRSSSLAVAS
ncbi:hypothetical protein AB0I10_12555 [Streptomyces sp. NPDC050636]|uniref:hypothetical protein n=1 Tax=Streptomyces sp. NPDC050636 TaxID=3154510 RepID=UPI00343024B8